MRATKTISWYQDLKISHGGLENKGNLSYYNAASKVTSGAGQARDDLNIMKMLYVT